MQSMYSTKPRCEPENKIPDNTLLYISIETDKEETGCYRDLSPDVVTDDTFLIQK